MSIAEVLDQGLRTGGRGATSRVVVVVIHVVVDVVV